MLWECETQSLAEHMVSNNDLTLVYLISRVWGENIVSSEIADMHITTCHIWLADVVHYNIVHPAVYFIY